MAVLLTVIAGCSDSDSNDRAIPPLHYSQQAPDLIDVCRFDARNEAADPEKFNLAKEIGITAETLGAALSEDSRTRVLIRSAAAEGKTQLYADSWLSKVAGETGISTLMARLDEQYESELFALDEAALYAMPFRFMVIPNGTSMAHVCMVDPAAYMSQFAPVSDAVRGKLQEAVNHFEIIIRDTFPNAFYDPQTAQTRVNLPQNTAPIITLGSISGSLNSVSASLEKGTFYYNNIPFKSGLDAFGDEDGTDDADDIFILYENPANRPFIEMRGFIPFKPTFFDLKGETSQVPNQSDTMVFLVQNSFIHIYDYDRRQVYHVNGSTVYQLQIYDGYADPLLISRGVSHFAAVPMSVFLSESSGLITVQMQNPVFKFLRYYADMNPKLTASLRNNWNSANPPNKVLWPDMSVEELGEFSLDTAQKVFDAAMAAISQ